MHTSSTRSEHQAEYHELHRAVGRALSTWVGVEMQLAQTFHIALGARDGRVSYAVFDAAVSLQAKISMVDTAVSWAVDSRELAHLQTEWKALHKRSKNLTTLRNKLAHWQVVIVSTNCDANGDSKSAGVRLRRTDLSGDGNNYDPRTHLNDGLNLRQLDSAAQDFQALAYAVFQFGESLRVTLMSAAKPPA